MNVLDVLAVFWPDGIPRGDYEKAVALVMMAPGSTAPSPQPRPNPTPFPPPKPAPKPLPNKVLRGGPRKNGPMKRIGPILETGPANVNEIYDALGGDMGRTAARRVDSSRRRRRAMGDRD